MSSPSVSILTVKDFIIQGMTEWDTNLIHALVFLTCGNIRNNRQIWKLDNKGLYSVKTSYNLLVELVAQSSNYKEEGDWNQLWRLRIPPKFRVFTWKACGYCLPS